MFSTDVTTNFLFILGLLILLFSSPFFLFLHYWKNKDHESIVHVFWTGGFDSTFRICQLLYTSNYKVQPIYVKTIIDNLPEREMRRRSHLQELQAIDKIRKLIGNPERLMPLIIIKDEIYLDQDIVDHMVALYKKKKMRRPICQYTYLAQISRNMNKKIEIAVEYSPEHSVMYRAINDSLTCSPCIQNSGIIGELTTYPKDPDLIIFKNFRFPTITLSKENMLLISKQHGFYFILKETWSCWYPWDNGKACGQCNICLERVI